jgi:hypothetical protein
MSSPLEPQLQGGSVYQPGRLAYAARPFIGLAVLALGGIGVLFLLSDVPMLAILVADIMISLYLVKLFPYRLSYLFLIHPLAILAISQWYGKDYLYGGDGESYYDVYNMVMNPPKLDFDLSYFMYIYGGDLLKVFKTVSLGVFPSFLIADFFFSMPTQEVYYLSQSMVHGFLCALGSAIALNWRIMEDKTLLVIMLFAAVSPTFFETGGAPSRHYVTFFAVLLLYFSHSAILQKVTVDRVIGLLIALGLIIISKPAYLLTYILVVGLTLFDKESHISQAKKLGYLSTISAAMIYLLAGWIADAKEGYSEWSTSGGPSFGALVRVPVLGWIVKYVYALLSPFPWLDPSIHLDTVYMANELLFVMHIFSAVAGLYLFMVMVLRWKALLSSRTDIRRSVFYGLIMSSSILGGAIGFHGYLSIFFPFLSPMILDPRLRVSIIYPILFIVTLEGFVDLVK